MAKIVPFRAVRPTRDKVGLVAARSYQAYDEEGREARMKANPFSFLHIVNPGYKYHLEVHGPARYQLVKNRYEEFKEAGIFIRDQKYCYYFHKIINRDGRVFHGIVGAASIQDYEDNHIKKHEDTLSDKEEIFKEYLKTVGFNAEPVLLAHPDNEVLQKLYEDISQTRAEYEFTTTYRDTHYVWIVDDPKITKQIQEEFAKMEDVYIADGHHRSASSYLLAKYMKEHNPNHTGNEAYNYFMTYNIAESDLNIFEFNRVVKDLNGLSKEEFLIKLDTFFRIENKGKMFYRPQKKHRFTMYLDGDFYSLFLRENNYEYTDALSKLDVQILYETILKPILGVGDPRTDTRLDYTRGGDHMAYLQSLVDSGEFSVGFGMMPVTIDEIKEIADAGLTMPPKATYIEPKLRSGITIFEF